MKSRATVKIALDAKHKEVENKLLVLRVTYRRRNRQFSIGEEIHLTQKQFDNTRLKKTNEAMVVANRALRSAEEVIQELGVDFTFPTFKEKYKMKLTGVEATSLLFDSLLPKYFNVHKCKYKTIKSYETSVNWVMRYRKNATPTSITNDFVDGLIIYMQQEHMKTHKCEMSNNTLNIYLRQLRAIYNFAIENGYTKNKNPFTKRSLNSSKRMLAALSEEEIKAFRSYEPKNKKEEFGKDFFLLSFHCNGANLGDILLFRNSNIINDTLFFVRRKTERTKNKDTEPIPVMLTEFSKSLFNKYGKISEATSDSLILPYLDGATSEKNIENRIKRIIRKTNTGLKSICKSLGWRNITTYNARHTFATTMRDKGMSIEQIQKLLGHSNILVTQTYLGSLSRDVLDKTKDILEKLESE